MKRCVLIFTLFLSHFMIAESANKPKLSIAAIADPQYADTQPRGGRQPRESLARVNHAVSEFNKRNIDFGVILGDIIDWDDIDYGKYPKKTLPKDEQTWKHKKAILKAWSKAKFPTYLVLGNHDYYVPNEDKDGLIKPYNVYRAYGFKDKAYYDFKAKGFRFVVLDGDEHYLHYSPKHPKYQETLDFYNKFKGPQKCWWNAAISKKQQQWLRTVLDDAKKNNEPVVIMCHYPIHKPDNHSLFNDQEILNILDQYPNIVLYLNGHNHMGDYKMMGNRHHLNLRGMQNFANSWYQLDFYDDKIKVYQAEKTHKPLYELSLDQTWKGQH